MRIVIDTSVLVAAGRSRLGASFALISMIPSADFEPSLSVALYSEWRDVLTRSEHLPPNTSAEDALAFLRYLAAQSRHQEVYFPLRPFLPDPSDDMILELAFAAGCDYIVTHNIRDFAGSEKLGVKAITPADFLRRVLPKKPP